ncbi:MAG: hypothetical protein HOM51_15495 [Rhodospirillaceae bacterium]|mgnify:FL=1|jgi:hypothetical protein|nr:hypothetical protein [Rhodospirillaceae bacterium]
MQKVGHHLQIEAIKKTGAERDIFARSAYNRYYYGAFLDVRKMLAEFDPNWAQMPHKSIPEFLKGSITKIYKRKKSRANRNGDFELIPKLDNGIRSAAALASLMEKANATRVIADYEPSEAVVFSSTQRFSLRNIEITEAHGWGAAVQIWTISIKEAWRQTNV